MTQPEHDRGYADATAAVKERGVAYVRKVHAELKLPIDSYDIGCRKGIRDAEKKVQPC